METVLGGRFEGGGVGSVPELPEPVERKVGVPSSQPIKSAPTSRAETIRSAPKDFDAMMFSTASYRKIFDEDCRKNVKAVSRSQVETVLRANFSLRR